MVDGCITRTEGWVARYRHTYCNNYRDSTRVSAFPTILGESLLQSIEVFRLGGWEAFDFPVFFVVFFVSAIVGIIALYLVLTLLYRVKFRFFSYYVWALAVFVAANAYLGLL